MKKKNSLSLTVVAVVVLCAVVVLITGLIGFVLSSQSSNAMRTKNRFSDKTAART